jgi:hypothetical protein
MSVKIDMAEYHLKYESWKASENNCVYEFAVVGHVNKS